MIVLAGHFIHTTHEKIADALSTILNPDKLKPKVRVIGEEIDYLDNVWEIYIYNGEPDYSIYLIQAVCSKGIDVAKVFAEEFGQILKAKNIKYVFEVSEESESGDTLGDVFKYKHI